MTERLRVGIVGANADGQGWAPISHFPALARCRGRTRGDLHRACRHRGGGGEGVWCRSRLSRFPAMVREPDIDLISVVVKVPNHHEVVTAALNARKHVYCEWPLGSSLAEAEAMAALARARRARDGRPAGAG